MRLLLRWKLVLVIMLVLVVGIIFIRKEQQHAPTVVLTPISADVGVNQMGYAPSAVKFAYTTLSVQQFSLVQLLDGQTVFTGTPKMSRLDESTGKEVYVLDFSSYKKSGTYQIRLPNGMASAPFQISPRVYEAVYKQAMRSYELQRCGVAIDDPLTHVQHAECHINPAVLFTDKSQSRDVVGGWHDAGDFGKYMSNAGVTVAQLLLLQELAPQTAEDGVLDLSQPASDDPDALAVIRVELDWMLKMQRQDGAVYHSVATAKFPGMILPQDDLATQYIYDISTPDTAIFAAAMARASRAYLPYDESYSQRLLDASMKAWSFLTKTKEILSLGDKQAYRPSSDRDKRVWAAAELYVTTGHPVFRDYVEQHIEELELNPARIVPSYWQNTSSMAILTLALGAQEEWELASELRQRLIQHADVVVNKMNHSPYGSPLQPADYDWGSTRTTLGYGLHLATANQINPQPYYPHAISRQLDWVLGANPLAQSFVTGIGISSPMQPHNRYTVASGVLIPGLLVGGPNTYTNDKIAPKKLGPHSYVDDSRSYATNENAIDYNAALVVVAGYLNEWHQRREQTWFSRLFQFQ
ncbi:endoglucanase [Brevibacillus reuszeri]|uniref:Endoglucanase n=1 Tax=Brevibacillus reuszeri TaxID=54915 RepID=A0A0K9YIW4_9BACL|nr:glycoside hydrolase family 9 protein [Brevibacillus reuszeri]KNB68614.1 hypothetical protein ADS79_32080 [Brevibacillus reuszeri]MED1858899.1 glycoside hydrolase family 9 protein [Brevibacillus reuszeri]GED69113.1 endoglucanase [Brevibacillus reuszeri]